MKTSAPGNRSPQPQKKSWRRKINANKDTFKMYTDMFLTEYIILAIHLNSQGALPDMVLNKVKENANLMV